ncbi:MAG TPA: MFS transporter [Gemmatimonadales bacterium]|nr:MFS transporter [Gemmatimonadales bacterium]
MRSEALLAETTAEARLYARVTRRLIPLLFCCYVAAYLDRVNIGFAKLQMLTDLRFSETIYGLGAGIFFIGYFLFEIPSNIILHRVGARRWIARVMLSWAVISASMVFVTTPRVFYILRFLLGVAEAGFFPGVILYLTYWYPAARRAGVIALFMTGIPIAGVIGGLLSGWILKAMVGVHGLAGWQWLFLLEALPSLVLGAAVLAYLDNGIDEARWLTVEEQAYLARRVAEDQQDVSSHALRDGLTNPRVWVLAAIYFCLIAGLYGAGFWLPTLIARTGVQSPLEIGILTVLPNAAGAIAMVAISRRSDAARERRWHLVTPALIGAAGWLLTVLFGANSAVAVAGMTLAMAGVTTSLSQFWCLPTALLASAAAATGIALINSIGNLAGFVSPLAIGWISDRTGSTDMGVYTLAGVMCIGSLLVLTIPKGIVNR